MTYVSIKHKGDDSLYALWIHACSVHMCDEEAAEDLLSNVDQSADLDTKCARTLYKRALNTFRCALQYDDDGVDSHTFAKNAIRLGFELFAKQLLGVQDLCVQGKKIVDTMVDACNDSTGPNRSMERCVIFPETLECAISCYCQLPCELVDAYDEDEQLSKGQVRINCTEEPLWPLRTLDIEPCVLSPNVEAYLDMISVTGT